MDQARWILYCKGRKIMKVPKYTKTKWKVYQCQSCKRINTEYPLPYCKSENHKVIELDNIPFFVPDMKITGFSYDGWANMRSDALDREFQLSPGYIRKIIVSFGVEPGGKLSNRWWMWTKSHSLKQVG